MGAVVLVGVEVFVLLLAEERLVGVKGFQLQKPAVLAGVSADEIEAFGKGLGLGLVFFLPHEFAVDPVLPPEGGDGVAGAGEVFHPESVGRDFRVGHLSHPGIALVAAAELPGVVLGVIGGAALFEVVLMVGAEVGVDAVLLEHLRHGVVEGLERPPTAMEEVVAAGVEFAPGGHAGQAAGVGILELDRAGGQTLEVGRVHPVAAVVGQVVPVQGVEHHHDGLQSSLQLFIFAVSHRSFRPAPYA